MLRVAIIGCGLVADQHITQINRTENCRVVAVCDTESLMAEQLADRFQVPACFVDANEMLSITRPDVVHITTPAQSHFPLAKTCLERGCHIYVEKPFALSAAEAEEIISLAEKKGVLVTAGHNLQFSPEALRMREMVKTGFLGSPPIHMECMQYFPHEEPTYGVAVLADRNHWVRSLPGSLMHNLISHGIAKIAEFLPSDRPTVIAHVHSSPYLQSISQDDIVDELRTIIFDGNVTASFTFSTQLRAASNQICLHGKRASLLVDSTNRIVIPIEQHGFKSYLRYFLVPRVYAKQYRRNSWWSVKRFVRSDFHADFGMKMLIQSFYRAVQGAGPLPISYKEILTTARIMDDIFAQFPKHELKASGRASLQTDSSPSEIN